MGTKGATGTGVQPGVTDVGIGGGHQQHERHGAGVVAGVLHRSGSSSSSSSEDDGHGGRRKKGMKEKIKEKLPGGHKHELGQTAGYGTEYTAGSGTGHVVHEPEKKGIMEKIKEKLPGHHQDKEQTQY